MGWLQWVALLSFHKAYLGGFQAAMNGAVKADVSGYFIFSIVF